MKEREKGPSPLRKNHVREVASLSPAGVIASLRSPFKLTSEASFDGKLINPSAASASPSSGIR